eukprot:scaffold4126_cov383-Prasinococcus_capsulatus_cf.AAC.14
MGDIWPGRRAPARRALQTCMRKARHAAEQHSASGGEEAGGGPLSCPWRARRRGHERESLPIECTAASEPGGAQGWPTLEDM